MARTYVYKGKRYSLGQMLGSPARRSTLPTELLSPQQQAQRKHNLTVRRDARNPLLNPLSMLSGHSMRNAANQLTNLELRPQIHALERRDHDEGRQAQALAGNAGDYYRGIAQEAQQGLTRQQAINRTLAASTAQTGQDAQARLAAAGQDVQNLNSQDAAVRGGGLQDAGAAAAELAAARGIAANTAQNNEASAARDTAAGETFSNQMIDTRNLRGGEVQERLALARLNQSRETQGQLSDLRASRGPMFTKNLLGLRDKGFENYAVQQGILGDQAQLAFKGQEADKNRAHQLRVQRLANSARMKLQKQAQSHSDAEKSKYELTADEKQALEHEKIQQRDRASQRSSATRGSHATADMPASARKVVTGIDGAIAAAQTWGKLGGMTPEQVAKRLRGDKYGAGPLTARAAAEILTDGGLSRATILALRRAGLAGFIPAEWKPSNWPRQNRPG